MVRPKGLEPLAHGLGNRCSILLSYGRIIIPEIHPGLGVFACLEPD